MARVPDRYALREPGLDGANCKRMRGNQWDIAAAGRAGVLHKSQRMELYGSGSQRTIFGWCWRIVGVLALSSNRIVKCPVLNFPLPTLHYDTSYALPRGLIDGYILRWKVEIWIGHSQLRPN